MSVISKSGESKLSRSFPSHDIDPKKKNKQWIAQFVKAAYNESMQLYPDGFFRARDRYHEIKLYMLGRQSVNKYKKMVDPLHQANNDKSWLNIDWSIIPIIPKFRRMALAVLNKKNYKVQAEVVDPLAKDDQDIYYANKRANIQVSQDLQAAGLGNKVNQLEIEEGDPETNEELDMHMKYSYKHRAAIEIEMALDLILNSHNNFPQIREKIRESIFDYGGAAVREFVDSNGYIRLRTVQIPDLLIGYSELEDFSNSRYVGEVRRMRMTELIEEAQDEISKEDYTIIAERFAGRFNNPNWNPRLNLRDYENYNEYTVEILDVEFFSVNQMAFEKRTNKAGNKVVGKIDPTKIVNGATHPKSKYKVVYTAKWVVGTDIFYQAGLATNMKRAKDNIAETSYSYHVRAPYMYNMQTYSIGEQIIPIADQIQLAWYKLQNVIMRAKPRGIAMEITALENVPLGKGGKKLKPIELLDLYQQRGDLVFRAIDEEGKPLPYRPIEELQNGLGDEAERWFQVIQQQMQYLRDILGFNEITDGSTPDPRMLNGVAAMAAQSTNNSVDYINSAEKYLVESMASDICIRIQDIIGSGQNKGYLKALGKETADFFSKDQKWTRHSYGIILRDEPDEDEKQELNALIQQALSANQITIADAVMVKNFKILPLAEEMLAYRIKTREAETQQRALEMQQENANVQLQSNQQAEQEKRNTMQMETEQKMQLLQMQMDLELRNLQVKIQGDSQQEGIRYKKDIDKKRIETQSKEYTEDNKLVVQTEKNLKE
jgi:hypothetical protein